MASFLPTLTLGDFIFEGFEEPYELPFGKEQDAYKHKLIGGGRVIDLFGAGDPDITWSGYFTGFQAPLRARYLESLCKQGQPLTLRTNAFIKQVVITSFTFGQHEIWPIQYTITVQVIEDKTSPINFQVPGDLTITVLEYLFQAETIAGLIQEGGIEAALALAVQAAEAAAPFDSAATSAVSAALGAAQAAGSAVNTVINNVENSIFGGGSNPEATPNPTTVDPNKLIQQGIDLQKLDRLYQLQNILNAYVIKNILLVGQSEQAEVKTFVNPNLYRISVEYYSDVDYWPVLAKANNITDPQLTGFVTLLIPPKPSANPGGILNP